MDLIDKVFSVLESDGRWLLESEIVQLADLLRGTEIIDELWELEAAGDIEWRDAGDEAEFRVLPVARPISEVCRTCSGQGCGGCSRSGEVKHLSNRVRKDATKTVYECQNLDCGYGIGDPTMPTEKPGTCWGCGAVLVKKTAILHTYPEHPDLWVVEEESGDE